MCMYNFWCESVFKPVIKIKDIFYILNYCKTKILPNLEIKNRIWRQNISYKTKKITH